MALLLTFVGAGAAVAQHGTVWVASRPYQPYTPSLHAQASLVQIGVVVRDGGGHALPGFTRADFRLWVDGRPATISAFSAEAPLAAAPSPPAAGGLAATAPSPLHARRSVALYFDDTSMSPVDLSEARQAALRFLASRLPEGEKVALLTASGTQLDFSDDVETVAGAVRRLRIETRVSPYGDLPDANIVPFLAYEVLQSESLSSPYMQLAIQVLMKSGMCVDPDSCQTLAEAQSRAIVDRAEAAAGDSLKGLLAAIAALAARPGERTLLLTSSGMLAESLPLQRQRDAVAAAALSQNVVIDSADDTLLQTYPPRTSAIEQSIDFQQQQALRGVMASLAQATGGEFFHDNNDLAGALRGMAQGPARYLLAYAPSVVPNDGALHKLRVRLAPGRHGEVQARNGYFDPTPQPDLFAVLPQALLDRELLGQDAPQALPARVIVATEPAGAGQLLRGAGPSAATPRDPRVWLSVRVRSDVQRLPLVQHSGRSTDTLGFATAVFDLDGRFVTGKQGVLRLELDKTALARFELTGIEGELRLRLAPGTYRLRELLREGNQGRLMALSRQIAIH